VVGKYAAHKDAYKSVYEALDHAGIANRTKIRIERISSDLLDRRETRETIKAADGILVPGGFGERGSEGKIEAIRIARENNIPFFGICLGMQCAVIEFARNVAGLEGANSTEFDDETPHPVITLMPEARDTMRLGAQSAVLREGSHAARQYGTLEISERHRHRYEFNPDYRETLANAGLLVAGTSSCHQRNQSYREQSSVCHQNDKIVEVVEVPSHPWFVAVQYHPEFKSQPTKPHPLFDGFVAAAVQKAKPGE